MSSVRPRRLVVVVGTGTDVGKTWVSAQLLGGLRADGRRVAARKLAQSYDPDDDPDGLDAAVLGRASGESPEAVCPVHRWYPVAMAPPMAADSLGRAAFSLAELLDEVVWPAGGVDVGLVETAGGLLSPHASDGDGRAVCQALEPDLVVLVAEAGLGTINSVRLTLDALGPQREAAVVVLNRYDEDDEIHRRNRHWLEDHEGCRVVIMTGGAAALQTLVGPDQA